MMLKIVLLPPLPLGRGCTADLLQFEAHGGNRIAASPEMFAREVALFARESGHRHGTLPFQKPDYRGDRVLGGIAMHICTWSGIRCFPRSCTPFVGPEHGRS